MALTKDDIRLAAERLHQAEKTRKQIRQLSLDHPGITIADAYAIQKAWIGIKIAEGRVIKGHKIGLTSKAMQSALNIDEPDSGVLLDDMFFADGGLVPSDRFIGTRVEAELAFIMKDPRRQTLWGAPAPRSWFEQGSPFTGQPIREPQFVADVTIAD